MSIADVREAQRAYDAAARKAAWARGHRDDAVRAALADRDIPQKDIMATTGLSRARLVQIRKGTR